MTQVDFYILQGGGEESVLELACKLTERASRTSATVYVHGRNPDQIAALNEQLWSFRDDAFVPHEICSESGVTERVALGCDHPPEDFQDVLINLADTTPPAFARFTRLLEIVPAEHEARNKSREKWRFYRDRGYPLKNHKIEA